MAVHASRGARALAIGARRTRRRAPACYPSRTRMATTALPSQRASRFRLPDSVSVLAERDFRVVWIGQAISMSGTWMQAIAQGLVVLALWDSPFALGIVSFANGVPALLVMFFGGVLADRADRRRILLV